jgi:hypothetical protein
MRALKSSVPFAKKWNRPVSKGEKVIVAAVRKGQADACAHLNPRNFGNLTAIKEKAEAFFENQDQVTRSLRHVSGRPQHGARSFMAPCHGEADQAGRAAFKQQHAACAAVY